MAEENSYLSFFTPSQMSAEMLEAILVKRQHLAARLVEKTKQSVLTATKHQTLLLGPRGIGKSYLVALVYHRVKALGELNDKIAIAYFAEEEWSVSSLTDLLLVILKSLEREYGGLQEKIDELYRLPVRDIESAAKELLLSFVGERTLWILAENLDEIFRGLGKEGQWAFRSFLSDRPFVTILATTPTLFAGVADHDAAFYGFFQNIYLEELTVDEATELLEKVAARRDDADLTAFLKTPTARERVQAVHDLAGGHPRIYLLFAHLLTEEALDELVTPFLRLLDELTPYYQSRMQLLSPQQRKIVEFLCGARGAVPVKEIALQNLMTSQTASGQLDKLEEMAYVRKTPVGRESYYELREPLLRMVIEVKRGRGEPVRLIVDFLRRWYDRRERKEWLAEVTPDTPLTRQYLQAALDLNLAVQDAPDLKRAERFSAEYAKLIKAGKYAEACEVAEEIIERKGRDCEAEDWFQYGYRLNERKRYKEALRAWNEVIRLDPTYADAWSNRGNSLNNSDDYAEALVSFDEAIALEPNLANAWNGRGLALANLGDYINALASYDKADALYPDNGIVKFNRAEVFLALGDWKQSMKELERAFGAIHFAWRGDTRPYCHLLLWRDDFKHKVAWLVGLYAKNNALLSLAEGLTGSIPVVLAEWVSQKVGNEWLSTWQMAGKGKPELEIPLKLLAAAVEWKRTRSVKALLALPIEERRILESLLLKDGNESGGGK